jgi:hypothetical protein
MQLTFIKLSCAVCNIHQRLFMKIYTVSRLSPFILLLVSVLGSSYLAAQSISQLSLVDALDAAIQRAQSSALNDASPVYQTSSWLAGLPSLSLSYLGSEERFGTDESELSINMPVKSGRRRSADGQLKTLSAEQDEVGLAQRRLYYSGLLREAIWSYRLADTKRRYAADKRVLLVQMEQRQKDLFAASAASEYPLLLLQSELLDVQVDQEDYLHDTRQWLQRYKQLTGLSTLPVEFRESGAVETSLQPAQLPQLRMLELEHRQRRQLLRANSAQADDWNLSLTAKNLQTDNYDEQQYGVGLEIPLSALDVARQSDNAQWRSSERAYSLARDQLVNEAHANWERLRNLHETLSNKQRLLEQSGQLASRIAKQLEQLRASNEIAQEIVLRRMMDAIDTGAAVAVNQVLIEQNNAMLRQAAGISI